MVELALPKNSQMTEGKVWPKPQGATNTREFRIYRWNPDDGRKDDDTPAEFDNADTSSANADGDTLDLEDDDEQLPWLESADDGEEEGPDTGRMIGFALIGRPD